jgi:hypothetical protein
LDRPTSLEIGEYEGRTTRRQDACIAGLAVLKAKAVDALVFVPE